MEVKMIMDVALVGSTLALTHVTWRAIPPEHKERAQHHVRRATVHTLTIMYRCGGNVWLCVYRLVTRIPAHLTHAVRWVAWTATTPLRRRD
jgi:hypothetical protein